MKKKAPKTITKEKKPDASKSDAEPFSPHNTPKPPQEMDPSKKKKPSS